VSNTLIESSASIIKIYTGLIVNLKYLLLQKFKYDAC
jgi:hypothetical protein